MTSQNTGLWGNFVSSVSANEFKNIAPNNDLFNRLVVPACFRQCAKTDVDIVFLNEMECAYKCVITYKQAYQMINDLDRQ